MECFLRRRETSGKRPPGPFSQIQLEAAGLKQQDSFLDQNLSRLEEETGRLLAEQKALGSGSGDSEQAVKERLLEIEAIKQQICAVQEEAGTFMKEAEGARQEKEALGVGQKDFFAGGKPFLTGFPGWTRSCSACRDRKKSRKKNGTPPWNICGASMS